MNKVCSIKRHPLAIKKASSGIQWPSFTGAAQLVGTSPSGKVTVYVDPSLGQPGLQNAKDLLAAADTIFNTNNVIFGTPGGPVNVIVFALGGATDGTGGADHMGCSFDPNAGGNIECCAAFGQSNRVLALFEAELSECSMNGNLCGYSTGEALSRWCAALNPAPNALADFASAPSWAQGGMPNYVDQTDPSDQNYPSIGCGMAFLSWVLKLGYPLSKIAPAMVALGDAGTLAGLYTRLTGKSTAWTDFQAAIASLGGPAAITSDDPFGGAATGIGGGSGPPPPPPPPPPSGNGPTLAQVQTAVGQALSRAAVDTEKQFGLPWARVSTVVADMEKNSAKDIAAILKPLWP